jgi:hypothetical protein
MEPPWACAGIPPSSKPPAKVRHQAKTEGDIENHRRLRELINVKESSKRDLTTETLKPQVLSSRDPWTLESSAKATAHGQKDLQSSDLIQNWT